MASSPVPNPRRVPASASDSRIQSTARLSAEDKTRNEQAIRAAMDRLLSGDLPPGAKCGLKSLAEQAGVPRTGFYPKKNRDGTARPGPYQHLAAKFEQQLASLIAAGAVVDPRAAQIQRLKAENAGLRRRIADRDETIAEFTAFKTTAISRLAAQHDEIERLRRPGLEQSDNIRPLPARTTATIDPC
ncbi:hypothetical protein [Catenulispora sp. GAS73]|uniref:hypothetical protein n=1 Tax=Catenulispora sp. GAS73 TaxID=3156269 RepID=UPI0035123A99